MIKKDYKRSLNYIMDVLVPLVGIVIVCFALWCIILPQHLAPGGAPGIAAIVNHIFGVEIGVTLFLVNVPLLILAWFFLGKRFTISTSIVIATLSFTIDHVMVKIPQIEIDPILASIFGGIVMGFGIGLVFTRGFTTGGTDILGKLIQLKFTHVSIGKLMLAVDFCIITSYAIVLHKPSAALYGLIIIFCSTKTIDFVISGSSNNKMFYIISDEYQKIAQSLSESIGCGVTLLEGQGGYSQSTKKIIVCVTRPSEFYKVKNMIYEIDNNSFVIITDSSDVFGGGFKTIKSSVLNR